MDYENLTPQYRIEEYLEAIVKGWAEATQYPYPDYPSWRIEEFLDAFITYIWEDGDHPRHPCPEPAWRLEECLRAIYDVMTGAATPWAFPTPTNSIEEYLAAIHAYLADNTELPVPEPVWRIEQWLAYVLDAVKQGGDITKTVSGTMVHITDALAKAALSVLASIEPIQDLHGYSSPWPAGGGVNMLEPLSGTNSIGLQFAAQNDGSIKVSGTATSNGGAFIADTFSLPYNGINVGDTITLWSDHALMVRFLDSSSATISYVQARQTSTTAVVPDGTVSIRVFEAVSFTNVTAGTVVNETIRVYLAKANSFTSWSPYYNICPISGRTGLSVYVGPTQDQQDATTYAVDWTTQAGTVYGGTVDVVTGQLTVNTVKLKISDLTWDYTVDCFRSGSVVGSGITGNVVACDSYAVANQTTPTADRADMTINFGATGSAVRRIYIKDSRYDSTTISAWQTAMGGTEIVRELANPITYQLTPQEVQMLLGENYVWSSSGDTVSVTYYAEGNANPLQSLNILLGGNYSNPKTADDVSDKEALEIILGGNK